MPPPRPAHVAQVLLHVGRRTYPDGGKHVDILRANHVTDAEREKLTSLPSGFSRGQAQA